MNHKLTGALLVMLTLGVFAPQAWCSMITVADQSTIPFPFSDTPYDITAAGNLDWMVCYYSEKDNATAITTVNNQAYFPVSPNWAYNGSFPMFSWTDGISACPTATSAGGYLIDGDGTTGPSTTLFLPAGDGEISVWWAWALQPAPATFTATFDDSATVTASCEDLTYTKLSYHSDTAQNLAFNMNGVAGIFAMAVSTVPEPGSLVLLATGLAGLLACVWRKRK
jgi:hypothetical protein